MWKFLKRNLAGSILLGVNALLTACVGTVELADGKRIPLNSQEFEDYVEYVFKYQNKVADELTFALVDGDAAESDSQLALEAAEAKLLLACSGLNELATARRDGLRLSVRRKLKLARQVPDCEHAAAAARSAIGIR